MTHVINQSRAEAQDTTPATDDSGYGLVMFAVFSAAVLFVTGAVALLALFGSWWMLGAAFAVHAATTAVVTYVVIHAMSRTPVAINRPSAQDVHDTSRRRGRPQRAALAAHR